MRPSFVIGLGGTGSWTNLYVKRRLLTDHRWRLLGQDPQAGATSAYDEPDWDVWLRAVDVDKENRPVFSQLRLDGTEDIGIGADVGDTIEHLKNTPPDRPSPYPTIEAWLRREEAERLDIGEAAKFMTTGAGQIRQFGRIAFFLDVLNKNVVLGRLDDALARLTAHAAVDGEVTTYVVASLAGGTGAGLLLDVLAYLQAARRKLPGKISFRTIVFLALPGAFKRILDPDQHAQAEANGMAALRELDRGINAHGTIELEWQLGSPARLRYALADIVYLVDGSRDTEASRQLEGYSPPEEGLPIAIADAIYAHMFPSSGHALIRGYPNLVLPQQGRANRYSSFGSYIVEFAWEPLLRSFTLRATGDLLAQLLAPSQVDANGLAEALLDGRSTDRFTSQGQQEPLPFLLTDVLASPEAARGGLAPSTSWLEPRRDAAPFPQIPALAEAFPDLGPVRTEYTHDQVIKETEALLERFWGAQSGHWTGGDPQFHPVANTNVEALEQKWERALHIAAAAVMSLNDAVGGVRAGLDFLDAVDRRLDRYCGYLDEVPAPNLTPYQEAVDRTVEKMQRGRWYDIAVVRQRAYIDGQQDLLQQQVADECLRRAQALLGRFRHALRLLREHVAGWQQDTLQHFADIVSEQRRRVDDEREQADRSPQRRTRPLPGDAGETRLYTGALGPKDDECPLPAHLYAVLQTLSWRVWTSLAGDPGSC
jgi:hypothetical protein